ncbi:hypothetical protein H6501_04435 [Candidatus Woesearchaeota archaeon]|nr:hypothetical protein [Nanoarchaeota archaeon]MCB9370819.1 hypothetical protein [Candidatus Woesearchaeota archaeon]USN43919.1 MAG: hypothetical protein H6500_06035 [Candidatus Woesearchaeota archaeon]
MEKSLEELLSNHKKQIEELDKKLKESDSTKLKYFVALLTFIIALGELGQFIQYFFGTQPIATQFIILFSFLLYLGFVIRLIERWYDKQKSQIHSEFVESTTNILQAIKEQVPDKEKKTLVQRRQKKRAKKN